MDPETSKLRLKEAEIPEPKSELEQKHSNELLNTDPRACKAVSSVQMTDYSMSLCTDTHRVGITNHVAKQVSMLHASEKAAASSGR